MNVDLGTGRALALDPAAQAASGNPAMRRSEEIRVGIVGAGGIARVHAENLRTVAGVRVAAVMDVAAARAEALASACGARAVGAMASPARRGRRGLHL